MKIAIIAPPWLATYPGCYYGIEIFIHNLTSALYHQGHEVVLFSIKGTKTPATKKYWYHDEAQYKHIHKRWYESVPVISAHLLYSLNIIRSQGDFDIVHDNNSFMGPTTMAYSDDSLPPILHTLHEPFVDKQLSKKKIPDIRMMFIELRHTKRMYFNVVSHSQLAAAPAELNKRILGVVHNAVNLDEYVYQTKKKDFFISVSRVAPDKGQATAAKLCHELGERLKIAGTIGSKITTKYKLTRELNKPKLEQLNDVDFQYYKKKIAPYIKRGKIEYLGTVFGPKKQELFANAKGFLMPIDWEEPFGLAVIDALASGTPVVAMNRGAMPEIIKHGVNGFLANNKREFKKYMKRIDQINPEDCRVSVQERFSSDKMAREYIKLYERAIAKNNK